MSEGSGHQVVTILIIVAVVIVVAAVGYLVYRFMRKSRDPQYAEKLRRNKAYRDELSPYKAALKGAQKEYDARVDAKNDLVKAAQADHDKAVSAQERNIKNIENSLNVHVDTVSSVKLYRDHVDYKGKTIRLTTSMKASVLSPDEYIALQQSRSADAYADAQLEDMDAKPSSVSGAQVVGNASGAIAQSGSDTIQATAEVGDAAAFLVLEDGSTSKLQVSLSEGDVERAKSFVTTFNCAAADVDNLRAQRASQIDQARQKLAQIKADTAAIEAAKDALRAESRNRTALDQAQQAFDEAKYAAKKKRDGL